MMSNINNTPAQVKGTCMPATRKITNEQQLDTFNDLPAGQKEGVMKRFGWMALPTDKTLDALDDDERADLAEMLGLKAVAAQPAPDADQPHNFDDLYLNHAPATASDSGALEPDLSEARRLMAAGFRLVPLQRNSKAPAGTGWNQSENCLAEIPPGLTGAGMPLAINGLCSIDPDDVELATLGLAALGFNLEELMAAGSRTVSTRPRSGGRSAFKAPPGDHLRWLRFCLNGRDVALELRAHSTNLQDTIPGLVYQKDGAGECFTQRYAEGSPRLDAAPELPPAFLEFWKKCSEDHEFFLVAQKTFAEACGLEPILSHCTGKNLPFTGVIPQSLRDKINEGMQPAAFVDFLREHGYTKHGKDRLKAPRGTGAPGIRLIGKKSDLWQSDHASDPLMGTFDPCAAIVILAFNGDAEAFVAANRKFAATADFDTSASPVLDPKDQPGDWLEPTCETIDNVKPAKEIEIVKVSARHLPTASFPPPFRGPMADLVAEIESTARRKQPKLSTLAALIFMSSNCNGYYHLPDGTRINLYGIGVAPTAMGKGHPQDCIKQMSIGARFTLMTKEGSGQGLEDLMMPTRVLLYMRDEMGLALSATLDSGAPAHLRLLHDAMLEYWGSSKSHIDRRALAKKKGEQIGTSGEPIQHPCLNVLGFTTESTLRGAITAASISSGLAGRFLFALGDPRSRIVLGSGRSFATPESVANIVQRIESRFDFPNEGHDMSQEQVDLINTTWPFDPNMLAPIRVSPAVQDRINAILQECDDEAFAFPEDSIESALILRSGEKLTRIAGVLAVWDNPNEPEVKLEHVEWALAMVRASNAALGELAREAMTSNTARDVKALFHVITRIKSGEIGRSGATGNELLMLNKGYVPSSVLLRQGVCRDAEAMRTLLINLEAGGYISLNSVEFRDQKPRKKPMQVIEVLRAVD